VGRVAKLPEGEVEEGLEVAGLPEGEVEVAGLPEGEVEVAGLPEGEVEEGLEVAGLPEGEVEEGLEVAGLPEGAATGAAVCGLLVAGIFVGGNVTPIYMHKPKEYQFNIRTLTIIVPLWQPCYFKYLFYLPLWQPCYFYLPLSLNRLKHWYEDARKIYCWQIKAGIPLWAEE
jgi:hypothetical protein